MSEPVDGHAAEQAQTRAAQMAELLTLTNLPDFQARLAELVSKQLALPSSQPTLDKLGADRFIYEALARAPGQSAIESQVALYLKVRYWGAFAAMSLVLGLFGLGSWNAYSTSQNAELKAEEAEEKAKSALARASDAAAVVASQTRDMMAAITSAQHSASAAASSAEAIRSQVVNTATETAAAAKASKFSANAAEASARSAIVKAREAEESVGSASNQVQVLKGQAKLQSDLMNAGALDILFIQQRTSGVVDLPRPSGGLFRVRFEISDITSPERRDDKKNDTAFGDVTVRVDGEVVKQFKVKANDSAALSDWASIPGTEGLYLYKVDQVFYIFGHRGTDYAVIRVKGSQALLDWFNRRSSERGRRVGE
ncbi:hypothetical protein RQP53_21925 [Paucibacter sp. APW11]|uniref:Uncharacterized protein n=1 Tax=Roseateles aquae TaxID=3077235 RepID=A0ABU3PIV1_9BURK|nr:hypothetical protein [Paucibacter sp. APW11]MDT9001951.1 hypothetical protein [Paucibacter sp. APW11]